MEYRDVVARPDAGRHVIVKPESHPVRCAPKTALAVPDGGSTLLFILAALTAMGWAATKRYSKAAC